MALVNFNQAVNCNAQSNIGNKTAVYMSATVPSDGNITINKIIQDKELYFENEAECKADYEEFNDKVEQIAKNLK